MDLELKALASLTTASLLMFAQSAIHADEVNAHRSYVGQFEFGPGGFLHPNKAEVTPADQRLNAHGHQGTITITGLGVGF